MGLQQFERRLERLVEGAFAKAFRGGLQPVELGRRLMREMDTGRSIGLRGPVAPNHAVITLSVDDAERFSTFADALIRELEDSIREHAREAGYRFVGPVEVEMFRDNGLKRGDFRLEAVVRQGPGGAPHAALVLGDGTRVPVGEDPIVLGRAPECDVPLGDSTVSRRHAEIVRDGDSWVVHDLDSSNGTRVNGVGVKAQVLNDGDELAFGSVILRFEEN